MLSAIYLCLAVFHLHSAWQKRRVGYVFWFGILALCLGLREWAESEGLAAVNQGVGVALRVGWGSLWAGSAVFIQCLWPFLDRPITHSLRGYQAFLFGMMLILDFIPDGMLAPVLRFGFWVELPLLVYLSALLLDRLRAGNADARTMTFGMLWLSVGGAHEAGHLLGLWSSWDGLSWGIVLFMVSVAFAISNHFLRSRVEAEALNRELGKRVVERTKSLEEAQARNFKLSQSASALRDPKAWADALESEIRVKLGGAQLTVWRWDGSAFLPLGPGGTPPDSGMVGRLRLGTLEQPERAFIPVVGPTAELVGVLVVEGKPGPWNQAERHLAATFAGHLSGALELAQLRGELDQVDARRKLERQVLIDEGFGALQVCPICSQCFDHTQEFCPDDSGSLAFSRTFPYRVNGRYRLTRFLGEGSTAQVFEAEDERLERRVALKAIKPDCFLRESTRRRFEQEAKALAQVDHPSVLAIFDSGELSDGTVYLVTELLLGASLGQIIAAYGPGHPGQIAQLLRDAGSALDAAHASGLLHRDLKPDNIFVLPAPLRFKLLDFGLAKEITEVNDITQTGMVMGTPVYMSPEQIQGKPMDQRSDLFSLGLVIWEALAGRRMLQGESIPELVVQLMTTPTPRIQNFRTGLPPEVDDLFSKALAKRPDLRAECCGSWANALANVLEGCPSTVAGWPDKLGFSAHHPPVGPRATQELERLFD